LALSLSENSRIGIFPKPVLGRFTQGTLIFHELGKAVSERNKTWEPDTPGKEGHHLLAWRLPARSLARIFVGNDELDAEIDLYTRQIHWKTFQHEKKKPMRHSKANAPLTSESILLARKTDLWEDLVHKVL